MDETRRPQLGPGPEFDLIRSMTSSACAPGDARVRIGPGDDAAVLRPREGEDIVVSCDMSVEDVHFRRAWLTWEEVGWRSVAAALSDLAAMGARPLGALIAAALAPELGTEVADSLAAGAGNCLREYDCPLVGGDLSRSTGPAVIDVTVLGSASNPISRAGALPGDELWVTGDLGAAALAAAAWERQLEPDVRARHRFAHPEPRCAEVEWLRTRMDIHAAIDLSDGLAGDARHMATASEARLLIEAEAIPLHAALEEFSDREVAVRIALTGGEDYELLLAAAPGTGDGTRREFESRFDIPLTRVGRVEPGDDVVLLLADGAVGPMPSGAYDHFETRRS